MMINWIDIIYNIVTVIGSVCIVHCIMWTWETDLSFSEMKWYQKCKVIAAKVITLWSMSVFLVYVFAVIIKLLLKF